MTVLRSRPPTTRRHSSRPAWLRPPQHARPSSNRSGRATGLAPRSRRIRQAPELSSSSAARDAARPTAAGAGRPSRARGRDRAVGVGGAAAAGHRVAEVAQRALLGGVPATRGPAPGRAVCLGQHRGVDRLAEGTRRRGLGRERPLRRCSRPNRQLGPERPPADYPWWRAGICGCRRGPAGRHCLVVLHGWEWPGDRRFRLPTGSRDVTIDGRQQTLWQCRRRRILDGGGRATGRADRG